MSPESTQPDAPGGGAAALRLIEAMAGEIGPRRPCSRAEAAAAELLRAELREAGAAARCEAFPSLESFGRHQGALLSLAVLAGVLPRRRRLLRAALAAGAAAWGALEGTFSTYGAGPMLANRSSVNLIAEIPPRSEERRTLCLVAHLDSSRSGLAFHPAVTPYLGTAVGLIGAALALQGTEALLARSRPGRGLLRTARVILAAALGLVAERELRGEDVAGANDNASGAATAAVLGCELAGEPLQNTRAVVLVTGSEEAGVLGMRSFLEAHGTDGWVFLNFDGVGGAASLRFLLREGGPMKSWEADARLVALARDLSSRRPELGLSGSTRSSGLPYDSTPVLARGGRALTLTALDERIPDYHWPTDTPERIDPRVLAHAMEAGRELIAAIDRGEAD